MINATAAAVAAMPRLQTALFPGDKFTPRLSASCAVQIVTPPVVTNSLRTPIGRPQTEGFVGVLRVNERYNSYILSHLKSPA
jgi:hypothetical protein